MASTRNTLILLIILSILLQQTKHAGSISVNYGLNGDNLPNPATVVQLFNSHGIRKLRLFAPNPQVQQSTRRHETYMYLLDMSQLAMKPLLGLDQPNLGPFSCVGHMDKCMTAVLEADHSESHYYCISGRSEDIKCELCLHKGSNRDTQCIPTRAIPGPNSQQVAPTMRNIKTALNSVGLSQIMEEPNRVLMVNVYPYFALVADPQHVTLEYAQFTAHGTMVHDYGLEYQNLFDAMVDAFYAAMENVGGRSVGIAVSETGWPNGGQSGITSPVLAETYNQKLIDHVKNNGTPKRPSYVMDVFIFAMFNENQKTPGVEQCFGLFYPNGQPVYSIAFT
ncbi:glucan endo-1,3-beta-glucosidase B-like [Dioscorea cayenensis subsp. rotundata]|uniref:Glucan endo-1,3-beta-glucosidase B-like n=1 Tax=Dioscorea cayennensis subsp. rotundata TaxID=55577 RepID=A0AB40D3K0_DIOCR|nr:glucan endo-1,3-beta-glucosidase B-like [Dioscorea cayenensis subsp. rotundata]